jgi:hypothetical protein
MHCLFSWLLNVEDILSFYTADSTSSKRKQVIRQLYSVVRSVKKNDNMNSMGNWYHEQDEV